MSKLILLPGIDGSKTIYRNFNDRYRLHSIEIISYPKKLSTKWMKSILPDDETVFLIGVSFGGVLARKMAQLFPERIKGVVLIDSADDVSGIYHPLKPLIPFFELLPTGFIQKTYQSMVYFKLRSRGESHALAITYAKNISHIEDVFERHLILPDLWVEEVHVPTLLVKTNSRGQEVNLETDLMSVKIYTHLNITLFSKSERIVNDVEKWIIQLI